MTHRAALTGSVRPLLVGMAAAIAFNVWKWRRDRVVADRLRDELAQPRPPMNTRPRVSILVAAWNESRLIQRHIESVLGLSYPNLEYVLCAGGADGTHAIAHTYARSGVTVLEQLPGEGKQRALRRAFEHSTGEILFLTDADCILDDDAFERTIEPLVQGSELASSGDSMPFPEQLNDGVFPRHQWAAQAYSAAQAGSYVDGLLGRNAAIRRSLLVDVGAFQDDVPTGTDYHLGKRIRRAGYAIRHIRHSMVRTEYPTSPRTYLRQQRRWIRNVLLLGAQSRSWHEVRRAAQTSAVGATMLLSPLAIPVVGRTALVPWAAAFVYSVAARIRYLAFVNRITGSSQPEAALLAPVYTLLEFVVWALPLLDYPVAARRWQW